MQQVDPIVARQYEAWVYPEPVADMAAAIRDGYYDFTDVSYFGPLYWPRRSEFSGLKILIAGCGTNQAAYHAMRNPGCEVVGVDISLSSLNHVQYLKEKHGLANLRLHRMNLEQVEELGESFDLIISTGVLHHLRDPAAGLRALGRVLQPDGAMSLMLYGKTLRLGVYLLQEAFRLMGLGQTAADVDTVRQVLAALPSTHPVQPYLQCTEELKYDTAIVDTFLHRQDRAYSVPEVFDFVESNGLAFVDWLDRLPYSVLANFPKGHPLYQHALHLSARERSALVDLLTCARGTHRFIVCHPESCASRPKFEFDSNDFLHYKPKPRPGLKVVQPGDPGKHTDLRMKRDAHEFSMSFRAGQLFDKCDGKTTIGDIIALRESQAFSRDDWTALARTVFAAMHDTGHFLFSI